jgi:hypothetical protein
MGTAADVDNDRRLRFFRRSRSLVWYLAVSLPVVYAWLKLRGSELLPAAVALPDGVLIRAALMLWYASWLYGSLFDLYEQERVYKAVPNQGRVPASAVAVMVGITVAFALLCSASTIELLVLALAGFWTINTLAWLYLTRVLLRGRLRVAGTARNRDLTLRERPRVVHHYLYGSWQAWRFGIGGSVLMFLFVALQLPVTVQLPGGASVFLPEAVPVGIALFIAGAELWVWFMRLRMRICLDFLNDLHVTAARLARRRPNSTQQLSRPGYGPAAELP